MRYLVSSLAMAAVAFLAFAGSAFAQVETPPPPVAEVAEVLGVTPEVPEAFAPDVRATDDFTGAQGTWVSQFVSDLDATFATQWGWRPSLPTTVVLFSDGFQVAGAYRDLQNGILTPGDRGIVEASRAVLVPTATTVDGQTDPRYVILVNLGIDAGMPGWEMNVQAAIAREYAMLMQLDMAGMAGPQWFRQGLADAISFRLVPGSIDETNRPMAVADALADPSVPFPTLMQLQDDQFWAAFTGASPESRAVGLGIAFLAVDFLADRAGGMPLMDILTRTAMGESFEAALAEVAVITLEQLDLEYRVNIPEPTAG